MQQVFSIKFCCGSVGLLFCLDRWSFCVFFYLVISIIIIIAVLTIVLFARPFLFVSGSALRRHSVVRRLPYMMPTCHNDEQCSMLGAYCCILLFALSTVAVRTTYLCHFGSAEFCN